MKEIDLLAYKQLIFVIIIFASYIVGMISQHRDKYITVTPMDWILGFVCSGIGGLVGFFWTLSWENIGLQIGFIIVLSLYAYPIIKILVSRKSQRNMQEIVLDSISNIFRKFSNPKNKNNET